MKEVEQTFKSQGRWDDAYGKSNLARIRANPEKFIVDLGRLPRAKRQLIGALPSVDGQHVLELGSGRGELSVAMAKLGGLVTGVDIGEHLVELSRMVADLNNVECTFAVGSICSLPFPRETFDLVVGSDILHHLPRDGVIAAVQEAHRVLKPSGLAVFSEPIENSKIFDYMQNLVPVGDPDTPQYRPSILQREKWRSYVRDADDRALSDSELVDAGVRFAEIEITYHGMLIRLGRLSSDARFRAMLNKLDAGLTHRYSPVKRLSQSVIVAYRR